MSLPLAAALRPNVLDDIIGQSHLLGKGKLLRRMVETKEYQSTIIWGPPGIGKTSIVRCLANETDSNFRQLNATKATVKDLRATITAAEKSEHRTILFVDEVHRWSKSQQDIMLPAVEMGTVTLFGATTENPGFAVNSTILSRCLVMEAEPLKKEDMLKLIMRVKSHYKANGRNLTISKDAALLLATRCSGDARKAITVLETCIKVLIDDDTISREHIEVAIPDKHIVFDSKGNDHFDLAHCYQEAIQNSDVDGAIYWLAKWILSGEDPAYICRRMLITAFEDCSGNPYAMTTAMAACFATERTGMPECRIPMAQATVEMAMSERNKAAYYAIDAAMDDVRNNESVHVPPELRAGNTGYAYAINKTYLASWARDGEPRTEGENRPDTVYAIGIESDTGYGMTHGPTPHLNDLLDVIGEENSHILQLRSRPGQEPLEFVTHKWIDESWIPEPVT